MITRTAVGYLLRRVVKPAGPGPWWTYVLSTATLEHAKSRARAIAAGEQVKALLQVDEDRYEVVDS